MKLPSLSTIMFFLVMFSLVLLITNTIIYFMAKEMCEKSEIKPIRWELGGLFGNQKIPIETTEGNQDSYKRICIKTGEPSFWSMNKNIEYIVNKQMEQNED